MYKVLKNGEVLASNVDLPSLDTKIQTYPISAMVNWLEARTDKEFGLQKLLDPWPTLIGKRGAIFEAEDAIYEFVEQ